jgi:hypothetical protein
MAPCSCASAALADAEASPGRETHRRASYSLANLVGATLRAVGRLSGTMTALLPDGGAVGTLRSASRRTKGGGMNLTAGIAVGLWRRRYCCNHYVGDVERRPGPSRRFDLTPHPVGVMPGAADASVAKLEMLTAERR